VLQQDLRHIIEVQLRDNVKARIFNKQQDNPYKRNQAPPVDAQKELYIHYQNLV
jgi:polyphosphate kinase